MNDRIGALQCVDGLTVVGQVRDHLLLVREVRVAGQIDAHHVVTTFEKIANDRAPCLPGTARDDDATHARIPAPADAMATNDVPSRPVRSR